MPIAHCRHGRSASSVAIGTHAIELEGLLAVPDEAKGLVLFAHGSDSSRLSPRNNYVADALHSARLATLLFDLLSEREAADRAKVFDVTLLAARLRAASEWVRKQERTRPLAIGYFGASTGAAAALIAAASDPTTIRAVVSRGGRADLAGAALRRVAAPTLLIVGSKDVPVIRLNEEAYAQLRCEKRLVVVPGATHLFEEPGTLDEVVRFATDWFTRHLSPADQRGPGSEP